MGIPMQMPSNSSIAKVWDDLTHAIATGDVQALRQVAEDISTLSPADKSLIEELASLLPPPLLPSQILIQILADPENSIGLISRLNSQDMESLEKFFGVVESSIVLSSMTNWMQTQPEEIQKGTVSIDELLKAYIKSQQIATDVKKAELSTGEGGGAADALQFLKNNPILLSSLKTADTQLLMQAFQIAMAQVMLACLDKIIDTQQQITQQQKIDEKKRHATSPSSLQKVVSGYVDDIRNGSLPITQSTMMLAQFMLANAAVIQITAAPVIEATAAVTAIASTEAGLIVTKEVVDSWNAAAPSLFQNNPTASPELLDQLGLMAGIYSQMAPYWSIPAAISLLKEAGGQVNEKTISEAAVKAYVVALGALISSPDFALVLQNLIFRNVKNPESITESQLKTYVSALKITLLLNALVALKLALIRKTGGQFSTEELHNLIMGKLPLPTDNELETGLIRLIQEEMKNLPEEGRETFLKRLLSTYSGKSDIGTLIDPSKQFLHLMDQSLLRNQTPSESV